MARDEREEEWRLRFNEGERKGGEKNLGNGVALWEQLHAAFIEGIVDNLEVKVVALVDEVAGEGAKDRRVCGECPAVLRVQPHDAGHRLNPVPFINVHSLVHVDAEHLVLGVLPNEGHGWHGG